jgi:hypothetical protein
MPLTAPDWLTKHDGSLRLGVDGRSWFVCFAREPQYELTPVPVQGRHGVDIRQTINGRHMEHGTAYATVDEALRGGLETLRQKLGW